MHTPPPRSSVNSARERPAEVMILNSKMRQIRERIAAMVDGSNIVCNVHASLPPVATYYVTCMSACPVAKFSRRVPVCQHAF